MNNISFIGMGNMALALCQGFIKSGKILSSSIYAYAPNQEKLKSNAEKIGFNPCETLIDAINSSDVILIACKPYQIEQVLYKARNSLKNKVLISVALGWNFKKYSSILDSSVRVQFVMPNTPAMVSQGVFLFEKSNSLKEDERKEFIDLFSCLGLVEELDDSLMGIGGAISGCGPAFVDLFIESYADAAVKYGIPRKTAYKLVSQTLKGSAELQLVTQTHPGLLKDNVCSPAGSTIKGVTALEEYGFRNACIKSIDAIMK